MTLEQAQKLPCFDCIRAETVKFENYEPELFCKRTNVPCGDVEACAFYENTADTD